MIEVVEYRLNVIGERFLVRFKMSSRSATVARWPMVTLDEREFPFHFQSSGEAIRLVERYIEQTAPPANQESAP